MLMEMERPSEGGMNLLLESTSLEIFVLSQNIWEPISKIICTNNIMYSNVMYTYLLLKRERMNGEGRRAVGEDEKF